MATLHERVAQKMAMSFSVGSFHSYETILAALRKQFTTEQQLRDSIEQLEAGAQSMGAPPGWKFLSPEDGSTGA
jgi:hypothetical protein